MNNKSCGCNRNVASRTMPRMPRCMAKKPECDSCKANNWSNDNTCGVINDSVSPSTCRTTCKTTCSNTDGMVCEGMKNNYVDTNWAKKYESSCSKTFDDCYGCQRKYRKCNKGCELTFGEEADELPIGMGYVPYQEWDCNVSNACQGLYDGTIFPELVKPFVCTYCYGERRGR